MKSILLRLLVVLASVGWIAPFTLSFKLVYDFIWLVIYPFMHGQPLPATSWYSFQAADELFFLAMAWLAAVIAGWSWRLTRRRRTPEDGASRLSH